MFDFLRNLGRSSEEERQQETLSAYLDNELAPADRNHFEQQLALDNDLQGELTEMKLWQAQMRNLPSRRVPRNFTLDPALYGRQQRQPFVGAYPVLRTATAVTAFLFVIVLAANLYLGDTAGETTPQPASISMQEMAPVVGEAAPAGGALNDMEMAAEEPPETFMLEESIDKETDEVPVEILESAAEEAPAESEEDGLSEEAEVVDEGDALLSEKPELSPSLDLEMIEETARPSKALESSAAPAAEPPVSEAEIQQAEQAPLSTAALDQAEIQAPPAAESRELVEPSLEDDAVADPSFALSEVLSPTAIGLGLLFVFLTALTLLARGRR